MQKSSQNKSIFLLHFRGSFVFHAVRCSELFHKSGEVIAPSFALSRPDCGNILTNIDRVARASIGKEI